MFACVWIKDYSINIDGRPHVIKDERWLGYVNPDDEENYFVGISFSKEGEKFSIDMIGAFTKTKKEFDKDSYRVCFFK